MAVRRAITGAAGLSALLCLATIVFWARSYWHYDGVWREGGTTTRSLVSIGGRVSVPAPGGRAKRYRLPLRRSSLRAGSRTKLRIGIPAAAAAGIRRALARRQTSTATLILGATNLAGDKTRVVARLVYRPRALRGLAAGAAPRASASITVER